MFQQAGPVLFVKMQDDFGVRCRAKLVAAFKLLAQLAIVVDFTVEGNPESAVFIRNRLVPAGKVDDAQPPVGNAEFSVQIETFVVRPAEFVA